MKGEENLNLAVMAKDRVNGLFTIHVNSDVADSCFRNYRTRICKKKKKRKLF